MKNLFSINMTNSENAADLDQTPYTAAHVSAEVRDKLDHAFDSPEDTPKKPADSAEVAAEKRILRRDWMICGVSFAMGLLLLFLDNLQEGGALSPLTVATIVLLGVMIVFYYKARRRSNRLRSAAIPSMDSDIEAATARLTEAAELAADELGVPKSAKTLEILPLHYKLRNGVETAVGKKNHFDNLAVSAWVENRQLCLASAQELIRVPLDDIRGARYIDEDFQIDFWLKDEEPDSEAYKEFNIRNAGFMGKKCRGYYAVAIAGKYELLIPGYDWTTFSVLADVHIS